MTKQTSHVVPDTTRAEQKRRRKHLARILTQGHVAVFSLIGEPSIEKHVVSAEEDKYGDLTAIWISPAASSKCVCWLGAGGYCMLDCTKAEARARRKTFDL